MSESTYKVWIYGHHIKPQWQEFTSLKELAARNVGRLPELIAGKNLSSKSSKQWKLSAEIPADDFKDFNQDLKFLDGCNAFNGDFSLDTLLWQAAEEIGKKSKVFSPSYALRKCGLTQWSHLKTKLAGKCSRCMLMNDEVGFQWSTGSYVAYRFYDKTLAREFWKLLTPSSAEVKVAPKQFKLDVGDEVELLEDFQVCDVQIWNYKRGSILRVYDVNETKFVPAPIPNETLLKVPGTKWSWDWPGYGWIPLEKVKLVKELR